MNLDHGAPIEDVKFFPSGIGQDLVTSFVCSHRALPIVLLCPLGLPGSLADASKLFICAC